MLLHHFFENTARRLPAKTALVCEGERHTYGDLLARVREVIAGV